MAHRRLRTPCPKPTPSASLGPELTLAAESDETTHFSVVDGSGMAVSNTYTLEAGYGSGVVVTGAGFLPDDPHDTHQLVLRLQMQLLF